MLIQTDARYTERPIVWRPGGFGFIDSPACLPVDQLRDVTRRHIAGEDRGVIPTSGLEDASLPIRSPGGQRVVGGMVVVDSAGGYFANLPERVRVSEGRRFVPGVAFSRHQSSLRVMRGIAYIKNSQKFPFIVALHIKIYRRIA